MIRVLIADDHPIVRQGVRLTLQGTGDIVVTGEAATGEETLERVRERLCDVVLLDISMPLMNGLDALKAIKVEFPDLPVLIMSTFPERQYAVRCLRAGASGYLTKESAPTELVLAITRVAAGRRYVSASLAEKLAGEMGPSPDRVPHETLSDREFQVMILIAQGKRTSQIAAELAISTPTVNTYRARILDKLHLESTAEIMHYAMSNHLVDLGDPNIPGDER
jgi:two-component system, NarL family, invasion response regulator UvrY